MPYLSRDIEKEALLLAKNYPVLTITGPRQSGKTTLARQLFSKLPYFSFENPDVRKWLSFHALPHRIVLKKEAEISGISIIDVIKRMINSIEVP